MRDISFVLFYRTSSDMKKLDGIKRTKYHASEFELSVWIIQFSIYFYNTVRITTIQHIYIYIYILRISNTHTHTHTYIYIIIMSCHKHRYPWPSIATSPYFPSPLADLQGYIQYPQRAAVFMFELAVLLLLGHMWVSIGVHHLWARPCFPSSVLHVLFM